MPDVAAFVEDAGPALGPWIYGVAALLAFLETAAFLGLLVPGELTVVVGGVLAGRGEVSPVPLGLAVWAAAFAGDMVGYAAGRRLGRSFLLARGRRFGVTDGRVARVERFYGQHGGKTILVGRFIGVLRAFTPFVAGTARMPAVRFAAVDVVGAGLWSATCVGVGYVFARNLDRGVELLHRGQLVLAVAVVAALAVVVARRRLRA